MFHPAIGGIELFQRYGMVRYRTPSAVKQHGPGRSRTLVYGEQKIAFHPATLGTYLRLGKRLNLALTVE
jgi:hypothetical protein